MRFFVLGQNKANMCTNSAVMEELVCLSSKWNILKASIRAVVSGREMVIRVGEMV